MGSLFRSAEMTLCQLFLQSEAAYACVSELGELGLVQFRDLNPDVNAFQRKFVNEVRRCDEMERKLRYLEKEIKKDGIPMLDTGENPEAPQPREMIDLEATFEKLENELREVNQNAEALKRNFLELTELKQILRKTQVFFDEDDLTFYKKLPWKDVAQAVMQLNVVGLPRWPIRPVRRSKSRCSGKRACVPEDRPSSSALILHGRHGLLPDHIEHEGGNPTESMTRALISDDCIARQSTLGPVQLGFPEKSHEPEEFYPCFVAGVILRERIPAFERMLWRACRGNVFLRQAEIETPLEDPSTGDQVFKSVFIIFFQGDQLKTRVKKICEGFRATLYPCPEAPGDRREMAMGVMTRIEDLNTVLGQTQDHRHRVLVAAAKNIKNWFVKVRKIKAIYHTLNLFNLDVTQKCLIAECWVPVLDLENIQLALRRGTERSGSSVPPILNKMETCEDPPTYNHTNKFTNAFQNLIDSYGIASYREMNPAPYTIITFPFLFAVMFGDCGHGLIMASFALWMVLKEKPLAAKKIESEIWTIFFGGRYIILLMGIFSTYTGIMYNDMFSKSLNIFGSHWSVNLTKEDVLNVGEGMHMLDPATSDYYGTPYPIGVDPVWQLSQNKIIFLNSYKMKISIILGVLHMLFGVVLSLLNHLYFKNRLSIVCEFIPQIIFMCFLFLYMVILMFIKWILFFPTNVYKYIQRSPGCAPSILITFINMVLFKPAKENPPCSPEMFDGQFALQKVLVVIALLCVPVMLLAKPIIILKSRNKSTEYSASHQQMQQATENGDAEQPIQNNTAQTQAAGGGHGGGHGEHENAGELFIHQGIHTIEFVLGSVSHTASYLRLWALSLAHAQLSEVLWNMVLSKGLTMFDDWKGGIALYIIFSAWACLTVSILVLMEGLSAFLHTLRLHWVEFQSKFYAGLGHGFQPFSFELLLDSASGTGESD